MKPRVEMFAQQLELVGAFDRRGIVESGNCCGQVPRRQRRDNRRECFGIETPCAEITLRAIRKIPCGVAVAVRVCMHCDVPAVDRRPVTIAPRRILVDVSKQHGERPGGPKGAVTDDLNRERLVSRTSEGAQRVHDRPGVRCGQRRADRRTDVWPQDAERDGRCRRRGRDGHRGGRQRRRRRDEGLDDSRDGCGFGGHRCEWCLVPTEATVKVCCRPRPGSDPEGCANNREADHEPPSTTWAASRLQRGHDRVEIARAGD